MNEKLYSMDLEASVLSILMTNCGTSESVDVLSDSDFYAGKHIFIFQQIKKLQSEGAGYDLTIINDICKKNPLCGVDEKYLMDICSGSTGSAHRIDEYITSLKNYTRRRDLFNAGERIKIIAGDLMQYDSIEAVAQSESVLAQLETDSESGTTVSAFDVSVSLFSKIDKRMQDRKNGVESINGIQTGFKDLDRKLGDIAKGDLVIIGARPSMGKTVMMQDIMIDVAARQRKPIICQSAEMPAEKVGERLMASIGEIPLSDIKGARIKDEHWNNYTKANNLLRNIVLEIDDKALPSLSDIRRNCRKIQAKHGEVGAVFIDYLTLLKSPIKTDQNHLAIGAISKGLKAIAKDFNCPVVCLSQLSREVDKRTDKRPVMSDLRESGQIEQDADIIMFLYRDEYYMKEKSQEKDIVEVIIAKARDGEIGTVRLATELQYSRFADIEHYGEGF